MRFNQLLGTSALVLGLLACDDSAQNKQNENLTPDELRHRLEVYSHMGAASDINSYRLPQDAQFGIVQYDSADVRVQLYLDLPSTYNFIMDRKTQNGDHVRIDELKMVNQRSCNSSSLNSESAGKYNVYNVKMSHVGATATEHANDMKTNMAEIAYYGQYASPFSTQSVQCAAEDGEYVPTVVQIANERGSVYVAAAAGQETINFFKTNYHQDVTDIKRAEMQLRAPASGSDPETTAYVVTMKKTSGPQQ